MCKTKLFIRIVFSIIVFGIMISCCGVKNIEFQALRPAQIKIGSNPEKVYIHCEYCINPEKSALLSKSENEKATVSVYILKSLRENLEKSPLFRNTVFVMCSSDSLLSVLKDNSKRTREYGLVILLDSIYLEHSNVIEDFDKATYYYRMVYKFGCSTYNRNSIQVIDNYLLEDTAYWPPQVLLKREQSLDPPDKILFETGVIAGEDYAHYLAPYWTDQSRIFYYGNKKFNYAYKHLLNNNLDSALMILQKDGTNYGRRLTSMNFNNMAVIYELKDDLGSAFSMADSAKSIMKTKWGDTYLEKLRIRKLDKAALDWQMDQVLIKIDMELKKN